MPNWNINEIDPNADITLADAAKQIGCAVETLYKWRKQGRLRVYKRRSLTTGKWLTAAIRGERR